MATFQYKIVIFQGQFSIISAVSTEMFENLSAFILQFGSTPDDSSGGRTLQVHGDLAILVSGRFWPFLAVSGRRLRGCETLIEIEISSF